MTVKGTLPFGAFLKHNKRNPDTRAYELVRLEPVTIIAIGWASESSDNPMNAMAVCIREDGSLDEFAICSFTTTDPTNK